MHPVTRTVPPEWCHETKDGAVIVEIPLAEMPRAFEIGRASGYEIRWSWAGVDEARWDEFLRLGDTTARSRAEMHGVGAVMNQRMKADVSRRTPVRSVMGAVVVPAAIAGHPLACLSPGQGKQKSDRLWINLSAPCHEDAANFWKRCTESLAKAVVASRTRPVEVIPYVAAEDGWGYEVGSKRIPVYVMYTRIHVNTYSWTRLGQLLHPSMLRVITLGLLNALSHTGSNGNGGHATFTNEGGLRQLRDAGVDPDTWLDTRHERIR